MLDILNLDIAPDKFRQLYSAIAGNYTTITMGGYVVSGNKFPKRFVLMRHDINGQAKNTPVMEGKILE